jgi:hypothetical protein
LHAVAKRLQLFSKKPKAVWPDLIWRRSEPCCFLHAKRIGEVEGASVYVLAKKSSPRAYSGRTLAWWQLKGQATEAALGYRHTSRIEDRRRTLRCQRDPSLGCGL